MKTKTVIMGAVLIAAIVVIGTNSISTVKAQVAGLQSRQGGASVPGTFGSAIVSGAQTGSFGPFVSNAAHELGGLSCNSINAQAGNNPPGVGCGPFLP